MKLSIVAILILIAAAVGSSQSAFAPAAASDVSDWTDQHVLFPDAHDIFTQLKILQDQRYRLQWHHRHPILSRLMAQASAPKNSDRDWSLSLGGGSTGSQSFPSKFVFDVTLPPDCTRDFVVTGISAAGSAGQANIIAVNNLYSNASGTGFCPGTGPKVMFAYNVGPGTVPASVVISLDGKKLAFIENNGANTYFHVLTYKTGTGNGTSATSPASPPNGADVKLKLNQASTNTVFVDYTHDTAYATTYGTNGTVYKVSGVFQGTPALMSTNGWPITLTGITPSTPVYDSVSKHVFFKGINGTVYYVDDSVTPAKLSATTWLFTSNDISAHPVIVDSTNQKIYAYTSGSATGSALVGQATTNLTGGVTAAVGSGLGANRTAKMPDFSNAYYSGTTSGAYLYIAGNDSAVSNHPPALYRIGFNSAWLMNSLPTTGPLDLATNTANVDSSAVTEFYNSTTNKEYLFVGVSNACGATGISGGCIRSLDITNNGWPLATSLNNVVLAAGGGTSGIIVDNVSNAREASSVYYVTMTGNTLVKATQAGLL
jgi:hypothetical protein